MVRKSATIVLSVALLFSVGCSIQPPVLLPRQIQVEDNKLLKAVVPAVPTLEPISMANAQGIFRRVLLQGIQYRDIFSACHNRTQYVSLLLQKWSISSGKVWIIAPARYTLLSREVISISDASGILGTASWGYHVAPIVRVGNAENSDIYVIDPLFSPDSLITLNDWFTRINSPNSVYFFSGPNDYLFNSLDGLTIYDNVTGKNSPPVKLPPWVPNVLTGHFQEYDFTHDADRVADGLALSDLSIRALDQLLPLSKTYNQREAVIELIKNPAGYLKYIANGKPKQDVDAAIEAYYLQRKAEWRSKIDVLHQ